MMLTQKKTVLQGTRNLLNGSNSNLWDFSFVGMAIVLKSLTKYS